MNEEKRKKTRVHFKTQVTLKTDESEIEAEANSKDISVKGIFVNTKKDSGGHTVRYRDSAHGHIHEACPKHKGHNSTSGCIRVGDCF